MHKTIRNSLCCAVFTLFASTLLVPQENAGKGLATLVQGNERFGRLLLAKSHSHAPESNVVISPIGLTLIFAAIRSNAYNADVATQIDRAFGWNGRVALSIPARQLLAAFEEPVKRKFCPPATLKAVPCREYREEGAWITNTFLYKSTNSPKSPIRPSFLEDARRNFHFQFVATGQKPLRPQNVPGVKKSAEKLQSLTPRTQSHSANDVWITSGTHLQTSWSGNTFSMSTPYPGEFQMATGLTRHGDVLDSELEQYLYAKNELFEAAALPGHVAYMIVILPAPGTSIHELETSLVEHPELLDASLKREAGIVTMPVFRIQYESDFSKTIQELGITEPFENLDSVFTIPNSYLTEVTQAVDLSVTRDGIRANAETATGAVYGGLLAAPKPFHMVLDRPFVFLIRDQTTNALLFAGAVMDSTTHSNEMLNLAK